MDKVLKVCEDITAYFSSACSRCGKCCKLPFLFPEEKERLNEYLKTLKNFGDRCPFLEKNSCKIYSVRPKICRIYPFQLLPHGLFLINVDECSLAMKIYNEFKTREMINKDAKIVKISFSMLEEFWEKLSKLPKNCLYASSC